MKRAQARAALFFVASVLAATRASADPAGDAKDLFERGRDLRAHGDCAEAAPLFRKAYDVYPSALGALRNFAECEESLGRWATARRTWLDLKRATLVSHDSKYSGWDADAEEASRRLASRVAHLTVEVSAEKSTDPSESIEVTINGEPLDKVLVGTELDRDPGTYAVIARIGSGEPARVSVELATGESRTVHLVVAAAGKPLPQQSVARDTRDTHATALAPVGWVTLSVGLASLVGMGVALGVRQSALSTLDAQCPTHTMCAPSLADTVNRGQAASTAVSVLAVIGGVATFAGGLLLVIGSTSRAHASNAAVILSPTGASFAMRFQ